MAPPPVAAASTGDIQLVVHDAPVLPEKDDAAQAAADVATARTLVKQSRLIEAIAQMEKAVRAAPGNVSYRFNLAILYDRAGQNRDALVLYRQVLKAAEYGEVPDRASLIETSAADAAAGRVSPQALNTIRMRVDYLEGLERE
jgi:thioredoxin-like negative regulator of GroEL